MKNQNLVVAIAAAAALTSGAFAQVFNYSPGDLLVGIRQDSNPTTDLVIDLGPESNLANVSSSITSPYQITLTTTLAGSSTGDSIQSAIHSTFGASPSGLDISVLAAGSNGSGNLFLSAVRSTATTGSAGAVSGSTAWVRNSSTTQNNPVLKINNLGNTAKFQNGIGTSVSAGIVAGNGWVSFPASTISGYTDTANSSAITPYVNNGLEASYSAGSPVSLDFYSVPKKVGSSTASTYLGFFTLDGSAHLSYVPAGAVVPEPQSYAAVAGLGLVAFAAWRRRSSK